MAEQQDKTKADKVRQKLQITLYYGGAALTSAGFAVCFTWSAWGLVAVGIGAAMVVDAVVA